MLNSVKKLIQSGPVDHGGSAIAASVVGAGHTKYKYNSFSIKADGAVSVTQSVTITQGAAVIGAYATTQTSHANAPVFTIGSIAVKVSVANALIGSDVCAGVIVTLEP